MNKTLEDKVQEVISNLPYNKQIEIFEYYLESLKKDAMELEYLKRYGVDNWEGYSEAIREMHTDYPDLFEEKSHEI